MDRNRLRVAVPHTRRCWARLPGPGERGRCIANPARVARRGRTAHGRRPLRARGAWEWLLPSEAAIRTHFPALRRGAQSKIVKSLWKAGATFGLAFGLGFLGGRVDEQSSYAIQQMVERWSRASDERLAQEFLPLVASFFQGLPQLREQYGCFIEEAAQGCGDAAARVVSALDAWLADRMRRQSLDAAALWAWQDSPDNPRNHVPPQVKEETEATAQALAGDPNVAPAIWEAARQLAGRLVADAAAGETDPWRNWGASVIQLLTRTLGGAAGAYIHPHIQPATLNNAIHTFGVGLSFDQVFALLDDTPFAQGYSGVLVAAPGIYSCAGIWMLSRTTAVPWESVFNAAVEIRAESLPVSHDCVVGDARIRFCYRRGLAAKLAEFLQQLRKEADARAPQERGSSQTGALGLVDA